MSTIWICRNLIRRQSNKIWTLRNKKVSYKSIKRNNRDAVKANFFSYMYLSTLYCMPESELMSPHDICLLLVSSIPFFNFLIRVAQCGLCLIIKNQLWKSSSGPNRFCYHTWRRTSHRGTWRRAPCGPWRLRMRRLDRGGTCCCGTCPALRCVACSPWRLAGETVYHNTRTPCCLHFRWDDASECATRCSAQRQVSSITQFYSLYFFVTIKYL